MKLWRITFTGADDETDLKELEKISADYPNVEWGILFSQSKSGVPRYPSHENIEKMCDLNITRSAHLCGQWVGDVLEGNFSFLTTPFAPHFERIQLNCYKDRLNKALKKQIPSSKDHKVILGGNFSDIKLTQETHPDLNVCVLFDASGGHGKSPKTWPSAFDGFSCGYAGGLRPENLEDNLKKLDEVVNSRQIWIDMETGVRTNEKFDLSKVKKCLEIAEPWLLKG